MLFRRVVEHVREQNWTAVGIDFVIVVVGVFIGIQVANWDTERSMQRLGHQYTVELRSDLQNAYAATARQQDYFKKVLAGVNETEQLLSSGSSNAKSLVIAAYRASEFFEDPTNSSTWDQVVSSGHLGLIPQSVLDQGLADYYSYTPGWQLSFTQLVQSRYRRTVRSRIPLPVQKAIRAGCSDVINANGGIMGFSEGCTLGIDSQMLEQVAQTLSNDPVLLEDLRYHYSIVQTHLSYISIRISTLANLLGTLDAVLTDQPLQ